MECVISMTWSRGSTTGHTSGCEVSSEPEVAMSLEFARRWE